MANYTPVVDVNITINAVTLAQAGFGTPIFVDAHTQFNERTKIYTDASELLGDGFLTDSPAYKAAQAFTLNSPTPDSFKIGRRSVEWIGQAVGWVADQTDTFGLTVSVPYLATPINYTASVQNQVGWTVTDLLDAVKVAIDGYLDLNQYVQVTVSGSDLIITPLLTGASGGDDQIVTVTPVVAPTTFSGNYQGSEDAATTLAKIREYDDDWYFMTTHERQEQWVKDMAAGIQASNNPVDAGTPSVGKMYFQGSGDPSNITGLTDEADTSLFGYLSQNNYTRTVSFYHHTAETVANAINAEYPECAYVGYNAPYDAGSVTWANLRIAGLDLSRVSNQAGARGLNTNEKQRLAERNANFTELDAGVTITRFGVTAGQEWIDVIRGVDWLTTEIETAIKRLLFNQQGKKVPYNNQGIAQVREVIQSALQTGVNRGFLQSYDLFVPTLQTVLSTSEGQTQWLNRVLSGITFIGYLAGAIHTVTVNGSVQAPTVATAV